MPNPTHSPLPWKRGTDGLIFDANNEYVTDTCGTSLPGGEENQKLIVHAVNNHQPLLTACRQLLQVAEQLLLDSPLITEEHTAAILASFVIAANEGKEPKP